MNTTVKAKSARLNSLDDLNNLRADIEAGVDPNQLKIMVCHGTGCRAGGADAVTRALTTALAKADVGGKVIPEIKSSGCQGFCSKGVLVTILPEGISYQKVKPEDAEEIIQKTVVDGELVERLLYVDPDSGKTIAKEEDIPFYKLQDR